MDDNEAAEGIGHSPALGILWDPFLARYVLIIGTECTNCTK